MNAAEVIEKNKDNILERWLTYVNKKIPESKKYSKPALRNDIPEFLDKLVISLKEKTKWEQLKSSVEHGRLRAMFSRYSLLHLMREFRLLKITIFEVLDESGPVHPDERNQILNAIDRAVEEAGEAFFQRRYTKEAEARDKAEEKVSDLESLHQSRDHFVATVSHDLRNPISNIVQCVSLLRKSLPAGNMDNELLDIINKSANHADQLIQNLLDVNLIKSGTRLPVHISRCNLMEEVKASVESFALSSSNHFSIESEEEITGVWDCAALRRALDNLIQNAIRHGKKGGPVTVSCRQTANETALSVRNEGEPIPLKDPSDIFTRHNRSGESKEGWGLGLTLVKGVAEAHGGKVDVESSHEKGTIFTIQLPNDPSLQEE